MLAGINTPRGGIATASIAVAAVLVGLWLIPLVRHPITGVPLPGFGSTGAEAPGPAGSTRADGNAIPGTVDLAAPGNERPLRSSRFHAAQPAASAPSGDEGDVPTFDIVRVDPHGETVVAGRTAPGVTVALFDGGKVVAQVTADAGGQFVLLPPALAAGDHYLTLQVTRDGRPVISGQGVAVSVAPDASRPMVALMTPGQPVRVLSDGSARQPGAATPPSGTAALESGAPGAAAPRPSSVAIQSVETGGSGTFTASGVAKAGSQCRIYLNGAFLADVTAGADGRWSVKVEKGMKVGRYTVRADQLDGSGGTVLSRAEVPFDFPAEAMAGHARHTLMAKATESTAPAGAAAPAEQAAADAAIVGDLQSATVIHGDSLWRISRKMLGRGLSYTEIYASNMRQIRNPRLIYPGQVFVVPHHPGQAANTSP